MICCFNRKREIFVKWVQDSYTTITMYVLVRTTISKKHQSLARRHVRVFASCFALSGFCVLHTLCQCPERHVVDTDGCLMMFAHLLARCVLRRITAEPLLLHPAHRDTRSAR